jgi:Zn-dependent M28 family amino/carboxypeptidase
VLFKLNENRSNIIILGAHYDTRARATKDSINESAPVPGANDGASGCAILIELAKILFLERENLSCQIWFLFFDAEDQGYDEGPGISGWDWCEGSQAFVNDINNFYNSSNEDFDAMILLDMVGGVNLRFINEQYSTSSLLDELFAIGRQLGYTSQFPSNPENAAITDDHVAFLNTGIPSADLIINFWNNPGWPYHHTTLDNISFISNTSLEITGKTIEQFIYNNYFIDPYNTYKGNFPWDRDLSIPYLEELLFLLMVGSFIGVGITLLFIFKTIFHEKYLNREED